MKTLENPDGKIVNTERFYFAHGRGIRTQVLFGTQRVLRQFKLKGYPDIENFDLHARCFDNGGALLSELVYSIPSHQEAFFDSNELFSADPSQDVRDGTVLLSVERLHFTEDFSPSLPLPSSDFNGILVIFKPQGFVTGVHMYHGVDFRSRRALWKHAVKNKLLQTARQLSALVSAPWKALKTRPWPFDAVGASIVHGAAGESSALAILHSDNPFSGRYGFLEYRGERGGVSRRKISPLAPHGTLKVELPINGEWGQFLCAHPPPGTSRFLTGEKFSDGSFCIDHTYFQQPKRSRDGKTKEVKFFLKSLLRDGLIGPSHPWPCVHNGQVETLIAVCNQYRPDEPHIYDLWVFDNDGGLALHRPSCIRVEPYGQTVFNISDELSRAGFREFEGTYLLSHSADNPSELLPSRLHAQGVYRFRKKYWNGVQSDSSIWSSPEPKVPEIENLSLAKVRRKQVWFAPVVESKDLESLIVLSNLSYSRKYDHTQTLVLSYAEGDRVLKEKEFVIKPFGTVFVNAREAFGEWMTPRGSEGIRTGSITIRPKTGITYCASLMIREKGSGVFMLEHVLPVPKFPHEIA